MNCGPVLFPHISFRVLQRQLAPHPRHRSPSSPKMDSVKLVFPDGSIVRARRPATFAALQDVARISSASIPLPLTSVVLSYDDDDGDRILILSDDDLVDACKDRGTAAVPRIFVRAGESTFFPRPPRCCSPRTFLHVLRARVRPPRRLPHPPHPWRC
jgi:hypothetical protein